MIIKINSFPNKEYNATAEYLNGKIIVLAGSKVNKRISPLLASKGIVMKLRKNSELIKDGILLKNCVFNSLSTAAQFVTGNITNGKIRWFLEDGRKMKEYLEEHKED